MVTDFTDLSVRTRRHGLDVLRGSLVLAMFGAHVARLSPPFDDVWSLPLRGFSAIEPAISAGFALVVGVSLGISAGRDAAPGKAPWDGRFGDLGLRALVLFALGACLHLGNYGVVWPDWFWSPDVLSALGGSIVATAAAMRFGAVGLAALVLAGVGLVGWLDERGVVVSGVNAGPGALFPLVCFAALGALSTFPGHASARRREIRGVLLGAALFAVGLVLPGEWTRDASSAPWASAFWNHTARGTLLLSLPLMLLALASLRGTVVCSGRSLGWLRGVGRHALLCYVGHLALLEACRRADLFPLPPNRALGLLVLLVGLASLATWLLETPALRALLMGLSKRLRVRL